MAARLTLDLLVLDSNQESQISNGERLRWLSCEPAKQRCWATRVPAAREMRFV